MSVTQQVSKPDSSELSNCALKIIQLIYLSNKQANKTNSAQMQNKPSTRISEYLSFYLEIKVQLMLVN